MECHEVQTRLSTYMEGSISTGERAPLEDHLQSCPRCQESLADLRRTMTYLKDLPEVEPPPWLSQRVMARVRSEVRPRKGILQWLLYPIHIKVPLEAAAVLVIGVITIYVFKTIQPEVQVTEIPLERGRGPALFESPRSAPPSPSVPDRKRPIDASKIQSRPSPSPGIPPLREEGKPPAPIPSPDRSVPSPTEERETETKEAFLPSPTRTLSGEEKALASSSLDKMKGASPAAVRERPETLPSGIASRDEPQPESLSAGKDLRLPSDLSRPKEEEGRKASPAPPRIGKSMGHSLSDAPPARALAEKPEWAKAVHLKLVVHDLEIAHKEVEKALLEAGGRIKRAQFDPNQTLFVALIAPNRYAELIDQLKPIGDMKRESEDLESRSGDARLIQIEIRIESFNP